MGASDLPLSLDANAGTRPATNPIRRTPTAAAHARVCRERVRVSDPFPDTRFNFPAFY